MVIERAVKEGKEDLTHLKAETPRDAVDSEGEEVDSEEDSEVVTEVASGAALEVPGVDSEVEKDVIMKRAKEDLPEDNTTKTRRSSTKEDQGHTSTDQRVVVEASAVREEGATEAVRIDLIVDVVDTPVDSEKERTEVKKEEKIDTEEKGVKEVATVVVEAATEVAIEVDMVVKGAVTKVREVPTEAEDKNDKSSSQKREIVEFV